MESHRINRIRRSFFALHLFRAVPDGTQLILIGDADADNKVTISDATAIQRHAADITNPDGTPIINTSDEDSFEIADMNKDGVIDVSDATAIQFHIAE